MPHRLITTVAILLFTAGVLIFSYLYGPHCRVYAKPARVTLVTNSTEINPLWQAAGVKGRIAVIFTRHLNAERVGMDSTESKYLELAMRQGVVRTVYYIVPDSLWSEVFSENLQRSMATPPKTASAGFVMLFEEGRVNVLPLSKFWPVDEKVLMVLEPGIWSRDELEYISHLTGSGKLATDLLTIIRGSTSDLDKFRRTLSITGR